mmetsp:Transcript_101926/g.287651  ORF Transcript_101926/g.287651 Transcript_101926/m.287651 type:complete len:236 (-) Transcript_101926:81-788(-)
MPAGNSRPLSASLAPVPVPSLLWALHCMGLAAALLPAIALLLPSQLALGWLAPGSALVETCGRDDGGTSGSLLWQWLTSPPAIEAFAGTIAPGVCAAAYSGLVVHRLLELLFALGLSAALLPALSSGGGQSNECGLSVAFQQRVLHAWAAYGLVKATVEYFGRAAAQSWLPGLWPWTCAVAFAAFGVGAALAAKLLYPLDASTEAKCPPRGMSMRRDGYMPIDASAAGTTSIAGE